MYLTFRVYNFYYLVYNFIVPSVQLYFAYTTNNHEAKLPTRPSQTLPGSADQRYSHAQLRRDRRTTARELLPAMDLTALLCRVHRAHCRRARGALSPSVATTTTRASRARTSCMLLTTFSYTCEAVAIAISGVSGLSRAIEPCFNSPAGSPFGMEIRYFLELERTLQGCGKAYTAPNKHHAAAT